MTASNKSTDSEHDLRLQEGDVEAFDALYWKYHEAVFANIYKLTKDTEATKDILQEVFVTLWEKRRSLDVNQSVSGWLFVLSIYITGSAFLAYAKFSAGAVPED